MLYVTIQDVNNPEHIAAGDISLATALEGFNDLLYNSTNFSVTIQDVADAMVAVTAEQSLSFGLQMPDSVRFAHELRYVFSASTNEEARKLNYLDRFVRNACIYARTYPDACSTKVQRMLAESAQSAV